MKTWIVIILSLWGSWTCIDLESESGVYSTFMPILFAVALITFLIKLVFLFGPDGGGSSDGGGYTPYSGGDGGDC